MISKRHLQHQITNQELEQFNQQGYLIVENALPTILVKQLEDCVDRIHGQHLDRGWNPHSNKHLTSDNTFFFPNFLGKDQRFVNLLDWHTTFPKVWGILGWNIYSYHSHFIVTPPRIPENRCPSKPLGWHQDSGRVNAEMESHPRPRLSLKIAYWLSDCSEPGRGNFLIIPGSHLRNTLNPPSDGTLPENAIPVCCSPGDAVFFDRRLWHAPSENHSEITRKGLFYGYGYRWLRSKDNMTISEEFFSTNDPIRQQLLGGGTNANGHFSPKDDDVPLKVWLEEHGIASM